MMRVKIQVVIVAALLGMALVTADAYPTREIEFVVAFPAGGPADSSARVLAPVMSSILKQPVVVVNKPGGGGALGSDYAAKAKPDGHTVYVSTNSVMTVSPHLKQSLPYKFTDFTPIGAFAVDLGAVTVRSSGPAKTLEEFVDTRKKNPAS